MTWPRTAAGLPSAPSTVWNVWRMVGAVPARVAAPIVVRCRWQVIWDRCTRKDSLVPSRQVRGLALRVSYLTEDPCEQVGRKVQQGGLADEKRSGRLARVMAADRPTVASSDASAEHARRRLPSALDLSCWERCPRYPASSAPLRTRASCVRKGTIGVSIRGNSQTSSSRRALRGVLAVVFAIVASGCGGNHPSEANRTALRSGQTVAGSVTIGTRGPTVIRLGSFAVVDVPEGSAPAGARLTYTTAGAPRQSGDVQLLSAPVHLSLSTGNLAGPATLTFTYDPSVLPKGVDPKDAVGIATYDLASHVWNHVPAVVDAAKHVIVATVHHFSWWGAWTWDWATLGGRVSQDILQALDKRAPQPTCTGGLPPYIRNVVTETSASDPLRSCAGTRNGTLLLRLTNNRSYGMLLHEPVPVTAVTLEPSGTLLENYLTQLANQQLPSSTIYLPPLAEVSFQVPDGAYSKARFSAGPTVGTAALDLLNLVLSFASTRAVESVTTAFSAQCGAYAAVDMAQSISPQALDADIRSISSCALAALQTASSAGSFDSLSGSQLDEVFGIVTALKYFGLIQAGITLGMLSDYLLGASVDSGLRQVSIYHQGGLTSHVGWQGSVVAISPDSLGAVRIGMTPSQASEAAGVELLPIGDGEFSPATPPPSGYAQMWVDSGTKGHSVACVVANGTPTAQEVETPEGFPLGGTVAQLKKVYGAKAVFAPAPTSGISPASGYIVKEDGGILAFVVRNDQVTQIIGGPNGTTPSLCGG